jgi:flagellar assembly protein FliH
MTWSSDTPTETPPAPSAVPPAPSAVSTYSFRQLEVPPGGPVDGIADVLSAAWAEAEQIRVAARVAGESEGYTAGLAAARAEAEPALAAMTAALRAVRELGDELVQAIEGDAILLALRLSEEIIAGALDVQPERLIDVARFALRHLVDRRHVTLVVNPLDLELMSGAVQTLQSELGGIQHLDVQADRRIGRGGAVARTEAGELDATVEAQLSRAREIVATELTGSPPDEH